MTVYVDDVRHPFGRMIMCHMWADTEEEMHAMAAAIGVARRWHQRPPKASWSHYDISLGMKTKALARGAVLTDRYGPSEHVARQRIASGVPKLIEIGRRQLEMIQSAREEKEPAHVRLGQ